MMSMMFNRPMRSLKRVGEEVPRCYEMRRGEQKETRNGSVEQEIDVRPSWRSSGVAQPQQIGGWFAPNLPDNILLFALRLGAQARLGSPALNDIAGRETEEGDGVVGRW